MCLSRKLDVFNVMTPPKSVSESGLKFLDALLSNDRQGHAIGRVELIVELLHLFIEVQTFREVPKVRTWAFFGHEHEQGNDHILLKEDIQQNIQRT